ncbi:anhydro-N-acetylmuramic acid kinase [Microbacterium sp.]|uniref:anhydro-N-acetylmuramic acid kinase n=1 Tax=Microbacterium sp. TaxID=51671 RepID=UPI003A92F97A
MVSDIRIRDITVGGHGARWCPSSTSCCASRAGVPPPQLGGISNMTVVRQDGLVAYDIGPANALVDAVIVEHGSTRSATTTTPRSPHRTGRRCAAGSPARRPVLRPHPPKSTGKEHFHLGYVHEHLAAQGGDLRRRWVRT